MHRSTEQSIRQDQRLWDLFTKKEEYSYQGDRYKRFSYQQSAYKDVFFPEVSQWLQEKELHGEYPDNKQFAICLTHDVDDMQPTARQLLLSGFTEFKQGHIGRARDFLLHTEKVESPLENLKTIIRLEEAHQARSAFYFLAEKRDLKRPRYDIEEYHAELCYPLEQGWEVGLHGSYYIFNDVASLRSQKEKIERIIHQKIPGFRYHYLQFTVPDTWLALSSAGFRYDTTFGYHDMSGFTNGVCHPFHPFNRNTDQPIDIIEFPLVLMDETLFNTVPSVEKAWALTKQLIDITEKFHGVMTICWHNDVFKLPHKQERMRLYKKILEYGNARKALLTSPETLLEYSL